MMHGSALAQTSLMVAAPARQMIRSAAAMQVGMLNMYSRMSIDGWLFQIDTEVFDILRHPAPAERARRMHDAETVRLPPARIA